MKSWNVLIPVVDVVRAETSAEAVAIFRAKIKAVGLDEYEGEGLDVFVLTNDDGEEVL